MSEVRLPSPPVLFTVGRKTTVLSSPTRDDSELSPDKTRTPTTSLPLTSGGPGVSGMVSQVKGDSMHLDIRSMVTNMNKVINVFSGGINVSKKVNKNSGNDLNSKAWKRNTWSNIPNGNTTSQLKIDSTISPIRETS